jgi:hypothetical protein
MWDYHEKLWMIEVVRRCVWRGKAWSSGVKEGENENWKENSENWSSKESGLLSEKRSKYCFFNGFHKFKFKSSKNRYQSNSRDSDCFDYFPIFFSISIQLHPPNFMLLPAPHFSCSAEPVKRTPHSFQWDYPRPNINSHIFSFHLFFVLSCTLSQM